MLVKKSVLKQERSLVVHARIDVVQLASIAVTMIGNGVVPRNVSELMGYIVDQLYFYMDKTGMIKDKDKLNSLPAAWNTLQVLGLTTKTMRDRNKGKLNMAWGFENLRNEGVDPEQYAPAYYKQLHNKHSVRPLSEDDVVDTCREPDIDMMVEIFNQTKSTGRFAHLANEPKKDYGTEPRVQKDKTPIVTPKHVHEQVLYTRGIKDRMVEQVRTTQPAKSTDAPTTDMTEEDDTPRKKTEDELLADAERIAKKDWEIANMDMSAPRPDKDN